MLISCGQEGYGTIEETEEDSKMVIIEGLSKLMGLGRGPPHKIDVSSDELKNIGKLERKQCH